MKKILVYIKSNIFLYIIIIILLISIGIIVFSNFDITNEVTQAAIITLVISSIANITLNIVSIYNNNKNKEADRESNFKLRELDNADKKETIELQHNLLLEQEKAKLELKLIENRNSKSDQRKENAINELLEINTKLQNIKGKYFFDYKLKKEDYFTKDITKKIIWDTTLYIQEIIKIVPGYQKITKQGDKYFRQCILTQNEIKSLGKDKYISDDKSINKDNIIKIFYPKIKFISNKIIDAIQNEIFGISRNYYCIDEAQ